MAGFLEDTQRFDLDSIVLIKLLTQISGRPLMKFSNLLIDWLWEQGITTIDFIVISLWVCQ